MATVIHDDFLDAMLGNPTHSVIDFNADNIDVSLLDETDSGTITASFVDYDEVDAATVVATTDLASITIGTVATGALDAADTTFSAVAAGDAADFLTLHVLHRHRRRRRLPLTLEEQRHPGDFAACGDVGLGHDRSAGHAERWRHHCHLERLRAHHAHLKGDVWLPLLSIR